VKPVRSLFIVRHGEAEHLVTDRTGGWTNSALTGRGAEQARRTGERLARLLGGQPFQFYSSDQTRARQTAEIVGRILEAQPALSPALRELNNGAAAEKTRSEAHRLRIPPSEPVLDWTPYPGGESWRTFLQRVTPFFEQAVAQGPEAAVWVTHGNVIVAAVQWWLYFSEEQIVRTHFIFEPASITWLGYSAWNNRSAFKLNDTAHLEGV
jgi:broad specificity phosphatase PhoE